jgi:hypothetical protein
MYKEVKIDELETIRTRIKDEMETTISFTRDDVVATIYTSDNVTMTKLKRAASKNPDQWTFYEMGRDQSGAVTGYKVKCPRKSISIVSGTGPTLTEEQRKTMAERMRAFQSNRYNK